MYEFYKKFLLGTIFRFLKIFGGQNSQCQEYEKNFHQLHQFLMFTQYFTKNMKFTKFLKYFLNFD